LDISWHVPSDEETSYAINLFETATKIRINRIKELVQVDNGHKKLSAEWTDEVRQSLKYLVSSLLSSIPLYQRCSPPEEWDVQPDEMPQFVPQILESMDIDSPDIDDDAADDDDDDSDSEAANGRSQKYVDGLINRPLTEAQTELLKDTYKQIGLVLLLLARYLWDHRPDDMQAFIELSTVWISDMTYNRLFMLGYILKD
jgi:Proteasome-substrate-size regulator, mid region